MWAYRRAATFFALRPLPPVRAYPPPTAFLALAPLPPMRARARSVQTLPDRALRSVALHPVGLLALWSSVAHVRGSAQQQRGGHEEVLAALRVQGVVFTFEGISKIRRKSRSASEIRIHPQCPRACCCPFLTLRHEISSAMSFFASALWLCNGRSPPGEVTPRNIGHFGTRIFGTVFPLGAMFISIRS